MLKSTKWLIGIATFVLFAIFYMDILTPLGWADYIFYFLPIVILLFTRMQGLPLVAAMMITVFMILGYYLSPPATNEFMAAVNRSYAVVSMWVVAFVVRSAIKARNEASRQTWLVTGRAMVAENIRGDHSVVVLVRRAVTSLCEYMQAQVGAVYVMDAKNTSLEYCSGYAVTGSSTLDQMPAQFKLGEGLIGQVALDHKPRIVDEFDGSVAKLQTGLVTILPKKILIAPIIVDNEVKAVMEIGFLQKAPEASEELVSNVSEVIGIGIRTAQSRFRLTELLSETQRQAEALQAQQEELRVTNEELEQQSRALTESQARLENNQVELEQSNQQLEEQMQELERQKLLLNERNDYLLQIQSELKKNRDDLERSTQYKTEFLANMSHELRTPLNSSLILAKLLKENKEKNLNEEQVRFAETIHAAGTDLLNLINDILDLSKIEAGKMDVRPERVAIQALASTLEKTFLPVARQKNLLFKVDVHPEVSVELTTDRQRLEQILKNFISNALKFTEKGEVRVIISPSSPNRIRFSVKDTGIGIALDQQEIIFEAFRQADGTTNRKFGGTGLGLSISRELSHLLGGRILLESAPGRGSTFSVELPLEYQPAPEAVSRPALTPVSVEPVSTSVLTAELPPETPLIQRTRSLKDSSKAAKSILHFTDDRSKESSRRRILIVEDDIAFARVLFDLAHEMGFDAIVATTADEGIDLAREYLPNAVLLDIRLPDHSGLTVLDQLKINSNTRHIPVHVISAEDMSRTALHMGAASYMLKPVEREQLVKAFEDLESRLSSIRRVLIVEDNQAQRESMVALISDKDAEIVPVESAELAIEKLKQGPFDCMIMDLSLPGMSGIQFLETLSREEMPYALPPVIVYTGRELTSEEELKLKRYSESIIVKGARSPERLLSEVTLFLHRVESNLPPDRQKMLFEMRNREKSLEGRRILIVDDDVRNIFAISSLLEPQGAKIEIARNGREALEKLEAGTVADLVLMDIMMPEMDGYEATRRIRLNKKWAKLPIIAVTAKAMRDDQERCLAAGANDYLSKPIDSDKLLSLIRVWMPTMKGN